MNEKFLDVVIAKPYNTTQNGKTEQKSAWNKVGRAWLTQSGGALNLELFMFSTQRFVIPFTSKVSELNQLKEPIETT